MSTNFFGLTPSDRFDGSRRPESYRERILELFPNGGTMGGRTVGAPLTLIMSKLSVEKVSDAHFNWFERKLAEQKATGTAGSFVYKTSDLGTPYAASDDFAAGTTVYIKMSENEAKGFRYGHVVLMRDASNTTNDVRGKVVNEQLQLNGASSYITVQLLEADGTGDGDLSDCDTCLIIGSAHPEGSTQPKAVSYDPEDQFNYCQIFRTPLSITGTASETELRTGDPVKDERRQAALYHAVEMEKAFIWGERKLDTGANGHPERYTRGVVKWIESDSDAVSEDYSQLSGAANAPFTGASWEEQGKRWLDEKLEEIFRFGADEKMALCGSSAMLGIHRLAELYGTINLEPSSTAFGLRVVHWHLPMGTIHLIRHPLMSYEPTDRNRMIVLEPKNMIYRHVRNRDTKKMVLDNSDGFDGIREGFLTEAGLEFHFSETMGHLKGVGLDNNN